VNVVNQFVFNKEERKLAQHCVNLYLSLFKKLVAEEGVEQSVTGAIIVGIKRAFPYAGMDASALQGHVDALFVLTHAGNGQQRLSALGLLQLLLVKGTSDTLIDRWYRSLYAFLLISPHQLPNPKLLTGFYAMLFKALVNDPSEDRVSAFVQRLLHRCLFDTEACICSTLLLIGELRQSRPFVRTLISRQSEVSRFDPQQREPMYAHAAGSCLWVLSLLMKHSHPSVVKLAVLLLLGSEIFFDSHPLDDLNLTNFLQMFADAETAGDTPGPEKGVPVFRRSVHVPSIPSTSDDVFARAAPHSIDVSAIFLHRYVVQRQRFIDTQNQVRSNWGTTQGDDLLAERITDAEAAMFGSRPKQINSDSIDDAAGEEGNLGQLGNDDQGETFDFSADRDHDEFLSSDEEDGDDEGGYEALGKSVNREKEEINAREFGDLIERHREVRKRGRVSDDFELHSARRTFGRGRTGPSKFPRGVQTGSHNR
jgi:ribosome biogenesis protein MAK21